MSISNTILLDRLRDKLAPGSLASIPHSDMLMIHKDDVRAIIEALTSIQEAERRAKMAKSEKPKRYRMTQSFDGVPAGKVVYQANKANWPEPSQRAVCFIPCGKGPWRYVPFQFLEEWPYNELDNDDAD